MKINNKNWFVFKTIFIASILIINNFGCKKILEVDPPIDTFIAKSVYSNNETAVSAMNGLYGFLMSNFESYANRYGISIDGGLLADELTPTLFGGFLDQWQNNLGKDAEQRASNIWISSYREIIYRLNAIVEGVSASDKISDSIKKHLLGEARFLRAYTYFYLVNFYGDVPIVLSTDFNVNSNIRRSPKEVVYDQIQADLLFAQQNLAETYLGKDLKTIVPARLRPNRFAATALLARVYLYCGKWQDAIQQSTKLIDRSDIFELVNLGDVFSKESREAIWQLQPNILDVEGANVPLARSFVTNSFFPPNFKVSSFLLNAFEVGDERRNQWITTRSGFGVPYTIPFKYKLGRNTTDQQEYFMVLRLGEQFLIRAECKARIGDFQGAREDINKIRNRASLEDTQGPDGQLLNVISHERQVELFTEWSDRWLDIKRIGKVDDIMREVLPTKVDAQRAPNVRSWAPYMSMLPIPYEEFKKNVALIGHQNPGYVEN